MRDSAETLSLLRQRVAAVEHGQVRAAGGCVRLGHAAIDAAIGGGLARARLHEVFAADAGDKASASGFAAMLASCIGGCVFWLREARVEARGGGLHAPGLAELGFDPARLIFALLDDADSLLRVAGDVVRCPDIAVAVIELWRMPRALDLTASRRLAVAAERSGVTPLLLRAEAVPVPSAAATRWQVAACPAAPLEGSAPGYPTLELGLLRQRGGPAGQHWRVEWDREQHLFRDAPLSGAVFPASGGGPLAPGWRRRA